MLLSSVKDRQSTCKKLQEVRSRNYSRTSLVEQYGMCRMQNWSWTMAVGCSARKLLAFSLVSSSILDSQVNIEPSMCCKQSCQAWRAEAGSIMLFLVCVSVCVLSAQMFNLRLNCGSCIKHCLFLSCIAEQFREVTDQVCFCMQTKKLLSRFPPQY